jgi:hypothetical protein
MDLKTEQHLTLKITEYGLTNQSFSISKLKHDLQLSDHEADFVLSALCSESQSTNNPNHILCVYERTKTRSSTNEGGGINLHLPYNLYTLTPTAFYNYVDYLEIKEARKVANEAKQQSILALQITVYSIIIATLFGIGGLFFTIIQIYLDHFKK